MSGAKRLRTNIEAKACFQGQTHGHEGFLLTPEKAITLYEEDPANRDVIFPFLTANDLLSTSPPSPKRYVIDFHPRDLIGSSKYKAPFSIVKKEVLPDREQAAADEKKRNEKVLEDNPNARVNVHHANFLKQWWLLSWAREEMINQIGGLQRYITCGRVTKRPIFEFVSPDIHPNDACMVFPFEDDYSFGILQSNVHWVWFVAKCSTLTERFRYTSDTVFDTFPWPQSPKTADIITVAKAAKNLRAVRRTSMDHANLTLRRLYQLAELPGKSPLKDAQANLDSAVRVAYGMSSTHGALSYLLDVNLQVASEEQKGNPVQAPGIPAGVAYTDELISKDRIEVQPRIQSKVKTNKPFVIPRAIKN